MTRKTLLLVLIVGMLLGGAVDRMIQAHRRPEEDTDKLRPSVPALAADAINADNPCTHIKEDSVITEMKIGECGYVWIATRDSNGDYLAYNAFTVHPTDTSVYPGEYSLIQRRQDGFHVWLSLKYNIKPADKPLRRQIFTPLHAHIGQ